MVNGEIETGRCCIIFSFTKSPDVAAFHTEPQLSSIAELIVYETTESVDMKAVQVRKQMGGTLRPTLSSLYSC
jgi:hypothetical protein